MSAFQNQNLLDWYGEVKRDLPWRNTNDPYLIWVSEIILQQTRVDQGMPYYLSFAKRFPTVHDLANATEDQVLKLWEGLGYYSRARNMHHTAKFVSTELKGTFPKEYDKLLQLKGVGPYTAAAIASIAFNLQNACVDGNVTRVVARYFGITQPVDQTPVRKQIDALAHEILSKKFPGEHNQAMMELGATCCSPISPRCDICPLRGGCSAMIQNLQSSIPIKSKKTKVRDRYFYYLVFFDGKSTILRKRSAKDIWQGLYEFPLIESEKKWSEEKMIQTLSLPHDHQILSVSKEFKHVLSHQRIHAKFVMVGIKSLKQIKGMEVKTDDLGEYALPRLINRYLENETFAIIAEV